MFCLLGMRVLFGRGGKLDREVEGDSAKAERWHVAWCVA